MAKKGKIKLKMHFLIQFLKEILKINPMNGLIHYLKKVEQDQNKI